VGLPDALMVEMSSTFSANQRNVRFGSAAISDRRRRKKKARHRPPPKSLVRRVVEVERVVARLQNRYRCWGLAVYRRVEAADALQEHADLWMG
jgi:hypothetical protein